MAYTGEWKAYFKNRDFVHQIGFYAPDWKSFAQKHHELFGSGPFYYTTNTFGRLIYRGKEVDCTGLKFHAAYGAWGSHSVEVVQQEPIEIPTMFTDGNDMFCAGMNHLHMFVEDLAEAQKACKILEIPIVTIGYPDLHNAVEKAIVTGVDPREIYETINKPSFMVVDMRRDLGMMVQLIPPRAAMIHNLLIQARKSWDGQTELFRKL